MLALKVFPCGLPSGALHAPLALGEPPSDARSDTGTLAELHRVVFPLMPALGCGVMATATAVLWAGHGPFPETV